MLSFCAFYLNIGPKQEKNTIYLKLKIKLHTFLNLPLNLSVIKCSEDRIVFVMFGLYLLDLIM